MVAWIALLISLGTLGILVWDKFLRRAKFDLQADWILNRGDPVLRFVVLNVGSRKGTVRDVRLKERTMPRGRGWSPWDRLMQHLPIVLDADEGSRAFLVQGDRDNVDVFEDAMLTGRINEIEVENARGDIQVFPLPELHQTRQNHVTNQGPDLPKT
jgi:hypothetical protein